MWGPPQEGSTPTEPALEMLPHEYLPPAPWQEPFKLSKLLKSIFLEGREVLISILLAICSAWDEPSLVRTAMGCGTGTLCQARGGLRVTVLGEVGR